VFTGQVCVLHSLDDVGRLGRGDVLVCPFTDPGWTPVLSVAGAVVAEAGGLLSHAAVLCRELGRPAVLSVANATGRLPNGQRVRVDGDHGHVDLLE
jgi:pyruvate,water dikinase